MGAFLLLFAAVAWGLIATTGFVSKRLAKASSILIHQELGVAGLLLLAIHVGLLLVDDFVGFEALDLVIPLHAEELTIPIAIGIVAMYSTVVLVISSWIRSRIGLPWWRRLHLLAAPTFVLAMLHGVAAGTDRTEPWMWWTYVGTALTIVFLLLVRALAREQGADRASRREPVDRRAVTRS